MRISKARQKAIINKIVAYFRKRSPYDTGNLSKNGIQCDYLGNGKWEIWVDDDWGTGIAPYMKYTNENWNEFAPPLKGKINPNEGWWDEACEHAIEMFCTALKGTKKTL